MALSAFVVLSLVICGIAQAAPMDDRQDEQDGVRTLNEYFKSDENYADDVAAFAQMKAGQAVDIVIDILPMPASDAVDQDQAHPPFSHDQIFGERLTGMMDKTDSTYFEYIGLFIDLYGQGVKPSNIWSVICDNGNKYYIQGRAANDNSGVDSDSANILAPKVPSSPNYTMNVLGKLTKMALENRNNGLPISVSNSRSGVTAVHTIIITDGASGAKLTDLTSSDITTTTVIDIGYRRYVKKLPTATVQSLYNVMPLDRPQELVNLIEDTRFLSTKLIAPTA